MPMLGLYCSSTVPEAVLTLLEGVWLTVAWDLDLGRLFAVKDVKG